MNGPTHRPYTLKTAFLFICMIVAAWLLRSDRNYRR